MKGFVIMNDPIANFRGEYFFLSNFYHCFVLHSNRLFPSVEHAYQWSKTDDNKQKQLIYRAGSPGEAKRIANRVVLRLDWHEIKLPLMRELLMSKFANPVLSQKLLNTGSRELIEGNTWGGQFWGVCNGSGLNWLGILLMDVRSSIRSN